MSVPISKKVQLLNIEIREIKEKVKNGPRFAGRAKFLDKCRHFIENTIPCFNPYADESAIKIHKEIKSDYIKIKKKLTSISSS